MSPARSVAAVGVLRLAAAAAFCLAAALAPAAATADPATDTALAAFVAAIDSSPDWNATSQGITTDASGATVLSGLKITSAIAGMTIDVDALAVTKGTAGNDGRYAATKVTAGKIAIAAGPLSVTLSNIALDDFAVPGGVGFAFDPAKPFSSIVHAYAALAKGHLGQARVASLAVTETLGNATSRVTYNDVALAKLDGGKIATLSAGLLVTESPIPDKVNPKPLVTVRATRADAKDIDLAALLRIYDPPPQGGQRTFQPAVGNVTYRGAVIQLAPRDNLSAPPGAPAGTAGAAAATGAAVTINLGTIALDDLRVRPPERNLSDDIDRSVSKPFTDEALSGDPGGMLNLLSAYSVGHFTAGPIDVAATGIDTIHLDGLSIAAMSLDGIGELAFNGFNVGVKDVASVKASRIAIGGLVMPKGDLLLTGLRTAAAGGDVDVSAIVPTVGFVELGGLDANVTGYPSTHLGKVRFDFANPIGNVPTSLKIDVADTDLDAVLLPEILREQLSRYGYTRLKTDVSGKIAWDEGKKQTLVSGLKLNVKDVGTLTVDAVLNGPTRTDFESLGKLDALLALGDKVSLASGAVSFKDDSIVGRVIADQANGLKVEPDKFRDQFARGLPFMLLPIGSVDFQRKAAPALQDFIRAPGTLTISAAPPMPVPLPTLISAAKGSGVFSLPNLLNLAISGVPGKPATPSPAAPAPVAPAAPAPGATPGTAPRP
jgi:hypothetical protein